MAPHEDPTLDDARIEMLRKLDEGVLLGELVATYRKEADARIASITSALGSRDPASLMRAAHILRGASANIGAVQMASLCKEIETFAEDGDVESASPIVDEALDHLPGLLDALEHAAGATGG